MSGQYFHRVSRETPTRLWINNPTLGDAELAIAAGAISCTTNPTFSAHMIRSTEERDNARALIDEALLRSDDDAVAADVVQQGLVGRVMEKFLPLYEGRPQLEGLVSIQGNPHRDEDPGHIIDEALLYRNLAPNFIAKIPVTKAGLEAIEFLVSRDVPVIATEVFAIAQAVRVCELYRSASHRAGKQPPFYVTHISGIFDEYLGNVVQANGIDLDPSLLRQAGCAVARRQYRIMREREYPGILLGGGARGTHHFTEMVGGAVHVTINWSTARELIESDPPIAPQMGTEPPPEVVDELCRKLPDFRKAFLDDGLPVEEFQDYGPLQYFRGMFIKGWDALVESVRERRRVRKIHDSTAGA